MRRAELGVGTARTRKPATIRPSESGPNGLDSAKTGAVRCASKIVHGHSYATQLSRIVVTSASEVKKNRIAPAPDPQRQQDQTAASRVRTRLSVTAIVPGARAYTARSNHGCPPGIRCNIATRRAENRESQSRRDADHRAYDCLDIGEDLSTEILVGCGNQQVADSIDRCKSDRHSLPPDRCRTVFVSLAVASVIPKIDRLDPVWITAF